MARDGYPYPTTIRPASMGLFVDTAHDTIEERVREEASRNPDLLEVTGDLEYEAIYHELQECEP